MVTILLFSLFGTVLCHGTEFKVLEGAQCKALEDNGVAFELRGDDIFYLTVSYGSIISSFMKKKYAVEDEKGSKCLARIERQMNATVSRFQKKLINIHQHQDFLKTFLKYKGFNKRASAASIAIAISLLDLTVTTGSFFYNEYRLHVLREKIEKIDAMVLDNRNALETMVSNQEYFLHEGEIIGLQRNLLLQHFNSLINMHSCDVLSIGIRSEILQMESLFQALCRALLENKLTEDVISLNALEHMTMSRNFDNTLYRVSPIHLYSLSKLSLHSYSPNDITFVVSFPVISQTPIFRQVALLEASGQMLVPRGSMYDNFRFLMPLNVTFDNLTKHMDSFRSMDTCIKSSYMVACHVNSDLHQETKACLKAFFVRIK